MSAKPTADGTPQKRLNIDVPEELAHQFKAYAALQGKSQREIFIAFMQRCARRLNTNQPDEVTTAVEARASGKLKS